MVLCYLSMNMIISIIIIINVTYSKDKMVSNAMPCVSRIHCAAWAVTLFKPLS